VGLAALGGMAVVGAAEYAAAGRRGDGTIDIEGIGRPSAAATELAERLDREGAPAPDPWRDEPGRDGSRDSA
jgi:hypothetical protein